MQGFYKDLLSYKLFESYGDEEMKKKVDSMLKSFDEDIKNGNKKDWQYHETDPENEQGEVIKFKKGVLTIETKDKNLQLELMLDFDFSNELFSKSLDGKNYSAVTLYENSGMSIYGRTERTSFNIVRQNQGSQAKLETTKGNIFKTPQIIKTEIIDVYEDEKV